jgi:dipeptidyl aminopeptidase/acylaminoacyl peptidase
VSETHPRPVTGAIRRGRRLGVACLALLGLAALAAAPASATFAGRNGRLALAWYDNDQGAHDEAFWGIVTVPSSRLTINATYLASCTNLNITCPDFSDPAYSPDGKRIVFVRDGELVIANANGSGQRALAAADDQRSDPSFAPSGQRLLFVSAVSKGIVTSDLSGNHIRIVTPVSGDHPVWSPGGGRILFDHGSSIWTVRTGGENPQLLIPNASMPDWSPDGRAIVYVCGRLAGLCVAHPNGTHRRRIYGTYPNSGVPYPPKGFAPVENVDQAVWSPDGTAIGFATTGYDGNSDPYIMRVPAQGGRVHVLWGAQTDTGGTDQGIAWQPVR